MIYTDTAALIRRRRQRAALLALPAMPSPAPDMASDTSDAPAHAHGRQDGQPGGSGGGGGSPATIAETGHEAAKGALSAPFTRTAQHDLRRPGHQLDADAWRCGACHETFWVGVAHTPTSCPRCEAQHPPVEAPTLADQGEAHADYLHDEPERFFARMDDLSTVEIGEVMVALSAFLGWPIVKVSTFLAKSRRRLDMISAEDVARDCAARRHSAAMLKGMRAC